MRFMSILEYLLLIAILVNLPTSADKTHFNSRKARSASEGGSCCSKIEIKAYLASCDPNKPCNLEKGDDIISASIPFPEFDRDERVSSSNVVKCRWKLIITMKFTNIGKTRSSEDLITLDSAYNCFSHERTRLLHPLVFKIKQEQVLQMYKMKFMHVVNAEATEEVFNKDMQNYTGCDDFSNNPTCGYSFFKGEKIPYSEGFCCSCNAAKNAERQPNSKQSAEEEDQDEFQSEKFHEDTTCTKTSSTTTECASSETTTNENSGFNDNGDDQSKFRANAKNEPNMKLGYTSKSYQKYTGNVDDSPLLRGKGGGLFKLKISNPQGSSRMKEMKYQTKSKESGEIKGNKASGFEHKIRTFGETIKRKKEGLGEQHEKYTTYQNTYTISRNGLENKKQTDSLGLDSKFKNFKGKFKSIFTIPVPEHSNNMHETINSKQKEIKSTRKMLRDVSRERMEDYDREQEDEEEEGTEGVTSDRNFETKRPTANQSRSMHRSKRLTGHRKSRARTRDYVEPESQQTETFEEDSIAEGAADLGVPPPIYADVLAAVEKVLKQRTEHPRRKREVQDDNQSSEVNGKVNSVSKTPTHEGKIEEKQLVNAIDEVLRRHGIGSAFDRSRINPSSAHLAEDVVQYMRLHSGSNGPSGIEMASQNSHGPILPRRIGFSFEDFSSSKKDELVSEVTWSPRTTKQITNLKTNHFVDQDKSREEYSSRIRTQRGKSEEFSQNLINKKGLIGWLQAPFLPKTTSNYFKISSSKHKCPCPCVNCQVCSKATELMASSPNDTFLTCREMKFSTQTSKISSVTCRNKQTTNKSDINQTNGNKIKQTACSDDSVIVFSFSCPDQETTTESNILKTRPIYFSSSKVANKTCYMSTVYGKLAKTTSSTQKYKPIAFDMNNYKKLNTKSSTRRCKIFWKHKTKQKSDVKACTGQIVKFPDTKLYSSGKTTTPTSPKAKLSDSKASTEKFSHVKWISTACSCTLCFKPPKHRQRTHTKKTTHLPTNAYYTESVIKLRKPAENSTQATTLKWKSKKIIASTFFLVISSTEGRKDTASQESDYRWTSPEITTEKKVTVSGSGNKSIKLEINNGWKSWNSVSIKVSSTESKSKQSRLSELKKSTKQVTPLRDEFQTSCSSSRDTADKVKPIFQATTAFPEVLTSSEETSANKLFVFLMKVQPSESVPDTTLMRDIQISSPVDTQDEEKYLQRIIHFPKENQSQQGDYFFSSNRIKNKMTTTTDDEDIHKIKITNDENDITPNGVNGNNKKTQFKKTESIGKSDNNVEEEEIKLDELSSPPKVVILQQYTPSDKQTGIRRVFVIGNSDKGLLPVNTKGEIVNVRSEGKKTRQKQTESPLMQTTGVKTTLFESSVPIELVPNETEEPSEGRKVAVDHLLGVLNNEFDTASPQGEEEQHISPGAPVNEYYWSSDKEDHTEFPSELLPHSSSIEPIFPTKDSILEILNDPDKPIEDILESDHNSVVPLHVWKTKKPSGLKSEESNDGTDQTENTLFSPFQLVEDAVTDSFVVSTTDDPLVWRKRSIRRSATEESSQKGLDSVIKSDDRISDSERSLKESFKVHENINSYNGGDSEKLKLELFTSSTLDAGNVLSPDVFGGFGDPVKSHIRIKRSEAYFIPNSTVLVGPTDFTSYNVTSLDSESTVTEPFHDMSTASFEENTQITETKQSENLVQDSFHEDHIRHKRSVVSHGAAGSRKFKRRFSTTAPHQSGPRNHLQEDDHLLIQPRRHTPDLGAFAAAIYDAKYRRQEAERRAFGPPRSRRHQLRKSRELDGYESDPEGRRTRRRRHDRKRRRRRRHRGGRARVPRLSRQVGRRGGIRRPAGARWTGLPQRQHPCQH